MSMRFFPVFPRAQRLARAGELRRHSFPVTCSRNSISPPTNGSKRDRHLGCSTFSPKVWLLCLSILSWLLRSDVVVRVGLMRAGSRPSVRVTLYLLNTVLLV